MSSKPTRKRNRGWIDVADRLPDADGKVLVCAATGDPRKPFILTARFTPGFGWDMISEFWAEAITAWQPITTPPRAFCRPKPLEEPLKTENDRSAEEMDTDQQ